MQDNTPPNSSYLLMPLERTNCIIEHQRSSLNISSQAHVMNT